MYHRPSGKTSVFPSKIEVRSRLSEALTQAAPSAKHVARETAAECPDGRGISKDTAEGLRAGLNIPNGYNLLLIARVFPEVRAVVRQVIDMESNLDPAAERLVNELILRMMRSK